MYLVEIWILEGKMLKHHDAYKNMSDAICLLSTRAQGDEAMDQKRMANSVNQKNEIFCITASSLSDTVH